MKKISLFLLFLFLCGLLGAQTAVIDSLENELQTAEMDTETRVDIMLQLVRQFWWEDPDISLEYVQTAMQLARENKLEKKISQIYNYWGIAYEFKQDYGKAEDFYNTALIYAKETGNIDQEAYAVYNLGYLADLQKNRREAINKFKEAIEVYKVIEDSERISLCYENLARLYQELNDYQSSIDYYQRTKQMYKELQDSTSVAAVENQIGGIYLDLSDFENALSSFLTALDIYEELGYESGLANTYNFLGNIYQEMNNFSQALDYYQRSLKINQKLEDEDGISVAYNNIGIVYDDLGDKEKALKFYQKSLEIDKKQNDKQGIATAFNNIGIVYQSLNQYDKALENLESSLQLSRELKDKYSIANTSNNIAELFITLGELEKAWPYLQQAKTIATSINVKNLLMEIYRIESDYYSELKQYEQAFSSQSKYYAIKDSIYSANSQKIVELQTQHATEKKEKEIELLKRKEQINKLKISTHKRVRFFFVVVFVLILIVVGILYYQFKANKRNSDFLDKVINSLPHPFVVINAENRQIELMNKSALSEKMHISEYDENTNKYYRKKEKPYDLDILSSNTKDEIKFPEYKVEDTAGTRYYEIHAYAIKDNNQNIKKIIEYAFNITDRKRAEDKIKRSETKFRTLFEGASDAIMMLREGKFVQCNKRALELYGADQSDLIGSNPSDFSPKYQPGGELSTNFIKSKLESVLQGNHEIFEWQHTKMNGEIFDAEISLSLLELDDENYIQAIIRDITKRLQTQRALEESEAKNSAILQAIPDIMFVFDSKGEYKEIHAAQEDDLFMSAQKLLGNTIRDMIPKKEADIFYYYIDKAFETGEIQRFEYNLKIGENRKYFEARLMVMEADRVLCIVRNYSKQKEAELALKKSEENFRLVVEDQTELICRLNKEGNMTFVNQSLCRYLGTTQESLLGTKLTNYLAEDDLKRVQERLSEITFNRPILSYEHRMIVDNDVRWTEWTGRKLFDENKEFIGWQAVGRDVTERKQAEEKLKQTNKELKELQASLQKKVDKAIKEIREKDHLIIKQSRHAAMGEMIGNIAHQWRQPLAAVAAIVQSFEDAYEDGDLDADYIEEKTDMMMDLLQHMSRTIDDFRNFFKPNKIKENFSLKHNIQKTAKLIASSFKFNNIELDMQLSQDLSIEGYPNEFSQVILNILNNSKDAFEANEVKDRKVKIKIHEDGCKKIVSVEDNAGGIEDNILDKIFDPYFTTKHQSVGTGLGLYMSKMIVENNMNGHLEVETWPGGTRFDIIL